MVSCFCTLTLIDSDQLHRKATGDCFKRGIEHEDLHFIYSTAGGDGEE